MRFEPHVYAHDDARAGLRDYLPRPDLPRPRRLWPWLVVLAFLLGFVAGVAIDFVSLGNPRVLSTPIERHRP